MQPTVLQIARSESRERIISMNPSSEKSGTPKQLKIVFECDSVNSQLKASDVFPLPHVVKGLRNLAALDALLCDPP